MTTILGHDPVDVAHRWANRARRLAAGDVPRRPDATPLVELTRSPAAARVAELAADAGLFSFHFEHRAHLPLPGAWVPAAEPDLAEPPPWHLGVLPERKYQSFRHDLPVASFHPHHRAKWSTHELCHGLVGFGWAPDATPFFHATAGRLAELLPVALWYFFDEAFLVRCADHAGDGALFRTFCPACERLAGATPHDDDAVDRIADGLRFVERELDAVARSRRAGRPIPHRWTSIDLSSDGVAYARAHGPRLASEAFATYMTGFAVAQGGWSPDLESLQTRVLDVLGGLLGSDLPALAPSASHGRWRWTLQDVGWRLLEATVDAPRRTATALHERARTLSQAIAATTDAHADVPAIAADALAAATSRWSATLPPLEEMLSLGYPLASAPPAVAGLRQGLQSCAPLCLDVLDADADAAIAAFAAQDALERTPLAARWASWLKRTSPGPLADLAAWESAVAQLPERAPADLTGPAADDRRRLGDTVRVVRADHALLDLAERADQGGLRAHWRPDGAVVVALDGAPIEAEATALVVARDEEAGVLVLAVDPAAADALEALGDGAVPDLPDDERQDLESFGVLVPAALAERHP